MMYVKAALALNLEGIGFTGEPTNDTEYAANAFRIDIEGNQIDLDSETITAICTKNSELVAEHEAAQYSRDRADAYPSIGDQLDMIFHAGLGGDEFQAAIQAVKDAYPKPE